MVTAVSSVKILPLSRIVRRVSPLIYSSMTIRRPSLHMVAVQILIDIRIIGFQYFFDIDCPAYSVLYKCDAML